MRSEQQTHKFTLSIENEALKHKTDDFENRLTQQYPHDLTSYLNRFRVHSYLPTELFGLEIYFTSWLAICTIEVLSPSKNLLQSQHLPP